MAAFFIRRPIVAIVIAIFTVLGGIVALLSLPNAQFPKIVPPIINLVTTYPGADAVTVEQSVATPIEQSMNGVDNMLYIQSVNTNDGSMVQRVTFDIDTDTDIDNVLVQNRFGQAQAALPQDVKNYGVTIKKSLVFPLLIVSLYSEDSRYSSAYLSNYATININDAILRVRGVGDIRNLGASDYSMRIWLKPDVLARLGLTVSDLQAAIRAQNVVNPAGQVGGEPAPPGQQFTYTVRAQGRLVTPEDFGAIIVRAMPDGSQIRIRDVARVELGHLTYAVSGTYNGKPSAVIAAYQLPGSNALDVAREVKAVLAKLKTAFPDGVDYTVSLDTTAPVKAGIEEIIMTLAEAITLVVLVVFLFLQSWRATLIPLLTVPVSLLGAIAFFPLLGFSINTLSLFGLVLAIGLVVDDAIVVVEAVEHHIAHGMTPRDAAFQAMKEVSGPVVGIALVLSAVFIPVAFMGGITGRLYQQFALTIVVAVIISAFNALTLSPALSAILLRKRAPSTSVMARLGAGFNRYFIMLTDGYVSISAGLIRKMVVTLLFLVLAAVGSGLLGNKLPSGFVSEEDNGFALVSVQLPDAASLQRTQAALQKVQAILANQPGVRGYNVLAGYSMFTGVSSTYTATAIVNFYPWHERATQETEARSIIQSLNGQFANIEEAKVFCVSPPAIPGMGSAGGFSMMLQDKSGGSMDNLAQNVAAFVQEASKRPELGTVVPNFSPAVPQIFVAVDKDKVLKQGVPIGDVYASLQAFLGGSYVNDFTRFGRQWKVFLQAEPSYRLRAEDVAQFYVRNGKNEMVPLSSFVSVQPTYGPEFTLRFNLFRSVEIMGSAAPGYSSAQALQALEEVAHKVLPEDMDFSWNGLSYQEKLAQGGAARAFAMSVLFVFLILAALYESWSLPFSVLLTTPLAVLGAYAGLWARSLENNVYAQIGLTMLVGLAAKNAILIVEFAKAQREAGKDMVQAALEGARLRLRPILMTSFAFIFGCAPLWAAHGAGAAARRILGTVVISGMTLATLLGVFAVPVCYVFVEKVATFGRRRATEEPLS